MSFALDTLKGYTINLLTGDSIKPLINVSGGSIKTGKALPLRGKKFFPHIKYGPEISVSLSPAVTIIPGNVNWIRERPDSFLVDTTAFKKIKLGDGDSAFVLKNSYGIIPTGVPVPVKGKVITSKETKPVKALPMRMKDKSTAAIQYLDVDQGLSFSYINAFLEDRKGNFWFGSDGQGISKYDGVSFTNYSINEGLNNGLVKSMLEDKKGNIWIGADNGLSKFDGNNFTLFTEKEGLFKGYVSALAEDSSGNIWICSPVDGVIKYDGNNFTHYTTKEGLPDNNVYSCFVGKNGNIWFNTSKGAVKFDDYSFQLFTFQKNFFSSAPSAALEDKDGQIWFYTYDKGVASFDGETMVNYSKKNGLPDNYILSLAQNRSGDIWIGSHTSGVYKLDGKKIIYFNIDQGLTKNKVIKMLEDESGNMWLSVEGGGINKLNEQGFSYLLPALLFNDSKIRPIIKDKEGNLWMCPEKGGLGKYSYRTNTDGGHAFTYYGEKQGISEFGARALLQDEAGNIWIGSTGNGIYQFDGKRFQNFSFSRNNHDTKQSIYSIIEDNNGRLWFGAIGGDIFQYDGKGFIHYDQENGLPGTIVYSMLKDKKGNLWFCKEGGLCKYDGVNLINYTEKEGLFCKSITSIAEDESGNVWLGTLGAGVCRFDGKQFTYFREQEGLSNNNVWSVYADSAKQIWAGTDKGLNLFLPKENNQKNSATDYIIYKFGFQDGLKSPDFNLHSVCVDDNNRIWWGTGKGLVSLDLNKKFITNTLRSLRINNIEINGQFYDYRNLPDSLQKNISYTRVVPFHNYPEELKLTHNFNHLTFHFSAIDWSAPHQIKYSHRLLGWDNKWSNPTEETSVEYRNISHGNYQFQLRAIGRSQQWTEPITYSFVIRPAWWQTLLFRSSVVIALIISMFLLIRFIYRYRLRKQNAILEKQLAVQMERQRISSEMHDDIGAGLSGVRLLAELTKSKLKNGDASGEVDKIYQSVGELSAKMKEVIWSLNTDNDSLGSLIAYLQKQSRMMMENYPGVFEIKTPEIIPAISVNGEIRRHIYLLVKEALHNIIKHSGANRVKFGISYDEVLRIVVSDNGKGLNGAPVDNSGNGMKNMRQRIRQLNGVFLMQDKDGLILTFEIPLK